MSNNGVFISTKIQVLRNLKDYKFISKISLDEANKVIEIVSSLITSGYRFRHTIQIDEREINYLLKKQLITKPLVAHNEFSAVGVSKYGNMSIMLNEQDHIVTTAVAYGPDASGLYERMKPTLDQIENGLSLAYDDEYGYLCSSLNDIGSAMHVSVVMCLVGLSQIGELDGIVSHLTQIGFSVRPLKLKNSYLYEIENASCLGQNEQDIINGIQTVAMRLQECEMNARRMIYESQPDEITDMVRRAYGVVKNCYRISYSELNELGSELRMGASLGLIDIDVKSLDDAIAHNNIETLIFKGEEMDGYEITLAKNIQNALKEN